MDRTPKKKCKYCGGTGHFPYACSKSPKRLAALAKPPAPRKPIAQRKPLARSTKPLQQRKPLPRATKPINKMGKTAKKWVITRHEWIKKNPPPIEGQYWLCYLRISPQCPVRIELDQLTLDHVVSRSRDPSKRFDLTNLQPACWYCNTIKGSRSLDQVLPPVLK